MSLRLRLRLRLLVVATTFLFACEPPAESGLSDDPINRGDGGSATLPAPSKSADGGAANNEGGKDGSAPAGPCKVSFAKEVLKQIDQAGCAGITCHGSRLGKDPRLEPDDAALTHKALLGHKIGGKPYVKPTSTDPADSAMHCHLNGECGVKMPPGGKEAIPKTLIAAVDAWLACGAPQN